MITTTRTATGVKDLSILICNHSNLRSDELTIDLAQAFKPAEFMRSITIKVSPEENPGSLTPLSNQEEIEKIVEEFGKKNPREVHFSFFIKGSKGIFRVSTA